MSFTNSQKGFSLIEIMVAMGIMGVAAVGGMKLMSNQLKSSKTVETRFEYSSIMNDIRETLGDKNSCTETFAGQNADTLAPGVVTIIKQVLNPGPTQTIVDKFEANTNPALAKIYGNGAVKIVSYTLSSTDSDPSIGIPPLGAEGSTNMIIKFTTGGSADSTLGTKETRKKIKLNVVVDPTTRNIISCSSTGSMADLEDKYVNADGDIMSGNLQMGDPLNPTLPANILMFGDNYIDFQSDKRLKYQIKEISTLNKIRKIHPVHYKWKSTGTPGYGVIAQELALIYPELVNKRADDFLSVNYIQLTPIMLKGIQEIDSENQKLKSEIKDLKEIIKQMKQDICQANSQASSCK